MKKALCFLTAVFLLASCTMFQLTDTQEVAGSILARRVGHSLAIGQPEMAKQLMPIAGALMGDTGSVLTLDTFISILTGKIDNPLLKADVSDLLTLIEIKGSVITAEEMRSIKTIMAAFLQGMRMGGIK